MSEFVFKLPDLGEGTVEAEIVEWHVKAGDRVREDDVIVDVMTDKANVEVPAPVTGTVVRTVGAPGDQVAVGAELIVFQVEGNASSGRPDRSTEQSEPAKPAVEAPPSAPSPKEPAPAAKAEPSETFSGPEAALPASKTGVLTSPAIRRRAAEAGIDLRAVRGSGPRGRILRRDLDAVLEGSSTPKAAAAHRSEGADSADDEAIETTRVIGIRRLIAQRMAAAKRDIPHFSYIEEIDVTELEALRVKLAAAYPAQPLTYLPFIAIALLRSLPTQPHCNAHFDGEADELRRYRAVHLGIAAQTPEGLKVPVVRNAQRLDLWSLAAALKATADAAKAGQLKPADLGGSTITLTSLGKLGGIASTPVINAPEVAIIGVNKAVDRPVILDGTIAVRRMMNLSGSFDHRIVDGHDAASLVATMKAYLEAPARLFLPEPTDQ